MKVKINRLLGIGEPLPEGYVSEVYNRNDINITPLNESEATRKRYETTCYVLKNSRNEFQWVSKAYCDEVKESALATGTKIHKEIEKIVSQVSDPYATHRLMLSTKGVEAPMTKIGLLPAENKNKVDILDEDLLAPDVDEVPSVWRK